MATARANLETTISADMSQFSATMRRAGMVAGGTAEKIRKSFGGKLQGSITKLGAGIAAAFSVGAFARGIKSAADLGGTLSDLSARTSIAAGELAVLRRAFEDNGVSADKIGGVINKLQKAVYEFGQGSEKAAKPFATLGISFAEISKLQPGQQFALIQQRIAAIEDPATRAALAMQLFGKSGGELLTLFADGGALTNAGKFLGTQADILNRRAGTFDEISDILARAGSKLQGFTVGVLDAIADDLLPALQYFDQLDLAEMGQQFGEYLKVGAQWVFTIYQVFSRIGTLIGDVFGMFFSADYWRSVGDLIWGAFSGALERLSTGLESILSGEGIAQAFKRMMDTNSGDMIMQRAASDLAPFYNKLADDLKVAFSPIKTFKDLKPGTTTPLPQIDGTTFGPPKPGPVQADGTKFGPDRSMLKPDVFGPSKDLMSNTGRMAALLRKRGAEEAAAGFGGLAGRTEMQRQKMMGIGPGENNLFAKDRERLGIASGLTTGGLGEKRRLKTSADNKEAKKQMTLAERQVSELEAVNSNLKKALTVA